MTDPLSTPDDAIDELQRHWSQRSRVTIEGVLEKHPHLVGDSNAVVDLIYSETLLREASGENVRPEDYTERFPEVRDAIIRQFQLHRALDERPSQTDVTTATAGITVDPSTNQPQSDSSDHVPRISGFEILELAGRGGSGIAYRSFDEKLKRIVAIKVLHRPDLQDDVRRRQLVREAEAAAALEHPSIVKIYQTGETDGVPYLVMEYIDGQPLAQLLKEGPLPVDRSVLTLISIAEAIDYAHQQSIVHRDLKPGNVLLDQNGKPHVCDFGLARQLDSEFTLHATGDVVGTPAYMSPEQARGESVSKPTDVYSLGAVLYHCLTGRPPFQAATPWEIISQVMTNDPPPIRQLNPSVPRDLETICNAALQKDRSRRLESAGMLAEELKRFRDGQPIRSRPVGRVEKTWKLLKRYPTMTGLIFVSVAAVLGLAVVSTLSEWRVSAALQQSESARSEAEIQRDVAFEAMQNLVYEVHDTLQKREASIEARGEVLTAAIKGLQKLIDTNNDRVDIQLAMAQARNRFGYILTQQGRNEEAEQEYLKAVEASRTIKTTDGTIETAQGFCNLAMYYLRVVQPDPAIEMAKKSIRFAEEAAPKAPDSLRPRLIVSRSKGHMSSALILKEQLDEALKFGLEALELDRQLLKIAPEDRSVTTQLADMDLQISRLYLQLGQVQEAEQCIAEAIPLIEAEASKSDEDAELARRFYTAMLRLGTIQYSQMRYEEALVSLRRAATGYQHLVDAEPNRPGFRLKLGSMQTNTIPCLLAMNQLDEAAILTRKSIEAFRKGMELGGKEYRVQRWAIFTGLLTLADLQMRQGELEESLKSVRQAVLELKPIVKEYQMESTDEAVTYLAEVLAGMLDMETKANAEDIARFQRSYDMYRAAQRGEFDLLIESEKQLETDIEEATVPIISSALLSALCLAQGLHHESLIDAKSPSEAMIAASASKVIQSVKRYSAFPGNSPTFYLGVPELNSIRQTKQFHEAMGIDITTLPNEQ